MFVARCIQSRIVCTYRLLSAFVLLSAIVMTMLPLEGTNVIVDRCLQFVMPKPDASKFARQNVDSFRQDRDKIYASHSGGVQLMNAPCNRCVTTL